MQTVAIYGGFSGTEYSREQRDPEANVTILSGDLLGDDRANFGNDTDNSHHVVTIDSQWFSVFTFDGLTIAGGNAQGLDPNNGTLGGGGAVFFSRINGGSGNTIRNCKFLRNYSYDQGGAIYTYSVFTSNMDIENCLFADNAAQSWGGASFSLRGGTPAFRHCIFLRNLAQDGAARMPRILPAASSAAILRIIWQHGPAARWPPWSSRAIVHS